MVDDSLLIAVTHEVKTQVPTYQLLQGFHGVTLLLLSVDHLPQRHHVVDATRFSRQ